MKNNLDDIDNLIKESLNQEEAEFYDSLDEQSLFEMLTGLFQTRHKWLILAMNLITFAALAFFYLLLSTILESGNH